MTVPVNPDDPVSGAVVSWYSLSGEVSFEIQLSNGGGQFLTVFSGIAGKGEQTCSFDTSNASDCRLLLKSGRASVSGIRLSR